MDLQIRGVSKTYPNGVQALKDVTLTIPAVAQGGLDGILLYIVKYLSMKPDLADGRRLKRIGRTLFENR